MSEHTNFNLNVNPRSQEELNNEAALWEVHSNLLTQQLEDLERNILENPDNAFNPNSTLEFHSFNPYYNPNFLNYNEAEIALLYWSKTHKRFFALVKTDKGNYSLYSVEIKNNIVYKSEARDLFQKPGDLENFTNQIGQKGFSCIPESSESYPQGFFSKEETNQKDRQINDNLKAQLEEIFQEIRTETIERGYNSYDAQRLAISDQKQLKQASTEISTLKTEIAKLESSLNIATNTPLFGQDYANEQINTHSEEETRLRNSTTKELIRQTLDEKIKIAKSFVLENLDRTMGDDKLFVEVGKRVLFLYITDPYLGIGHMWKPGETKKFLGFANDQLSHTFNMLLNPSCYLGSKKLEDHREFEQYSEKFFKEHESRISNYFEEMLGNIDNEFNIAELDQIVNDEILSQAKLVELKSRQTVQTDHNKVKEQEHELESLKETLRLAENILRGLESISNEQSRIERAKEIFDPSKIKIEGVHESLTSLESDSLSKDPFSCNLSAKQIRIPPQNLFTNYPTTRGVGAEISNNDYGSIVLQLPINSPHIFEKFEIIDYGSDHVVLKVMETRLGGAQESYNLEYGSLVTAFNEENDQIEQCLKIVCNNSEESTVIFFGEDTEIDIGPVLRKPVICFKDFPQDTLITLSVAANGCDFLEIYPETPVSSNNSISWEGLATKDDNFVYNDKKYPYLFWDGKLSKDLFSITEGFCVAKKDIIKFLEEKCDLFGFDFKLKTDFITFWAPYLKEKNFAIIRWLSNEECAKLADLSITAEEKVQIIRMYMIYTASNSYIGLPQQTIECVKLHPGAKIFDWGGFGI